MPTTMVGIARHRSASPATITDAGADALIEIVDIVADTGRIW
jgi:hypothetical protein